MTAQPLPHPESSTIDHPLTIDEYAALGEIEHGHIELQEGSLVMSPSPTVFHMLAIAKLLEPLGAQMPGHLVAVPRSTSTSRWLPPTSPARHVVPI